MEIQRHSAAPPSASRTQMQNIHVLTSPVLFSPHHQCNYHSVIPTPLRANRRDYRQAIATGRHSPQLNAAFNHRQAQLSGAAIANGDAVATWCTVTGDDTCL